MAAFFPKLSILVPLALAMRVADAAPVVPPVTVALAERAAIVHEVAVTGSVVSPRVSRISAEVAGWIAALHVEVGDRVARGALLVTLDAELSEIELEGARASERAAAAELADARRRLAEAERLTAEHTIAETEVRNRRAEVEIDAAALERSRAELSRHVALLARHTLEAPYAGAISRKLSDAGEWVVPGTPVVELVAGESPRIDFQVPQEAYPRIAVDMPVEIRLDAVPGGALPARVVGIVPVSDPGSRTFLMLTRLDDREAAIIPGMSARAVLRLDGGREGVVVPRDSVLRHPDGRATVWVLADRGGGPTVSERRIRTGRAFGGLIEVTDGLDAGTEVVLRGNEGLADGQRVAIGAPEDAR